MFGDRLAYSHCFHRVFLLMETVFMELIDTHCHLTSESLIHDTGDVLQRSRAAGINYWISVGTDLDDSQRCVALAKQHDQLWAAVGIHPHEAKHANDEALTAIEALAREPEVVALGETGLDFHYNFSPQEQQIQAFRAHLELAARLHLPVVIHTREAFAETMAILDEFNSRLEHVVLHCFSGSSEQARRALDRDYYLSFTGVVTFKNAQSIREAARIASMDRLMIETDCPYMSPAPKRKQKVNEPALLIHTARCLAELKEMPLPEFAAATLATSKRFFCL
jgi:TatD DNase family protein